MDRQTGYRGLQHLDTAKHGGQAQRVSLDFAAGRPDSLGHVTRIAAGQDMAGELHALPETQSFVHAADYGSGTTEPSTTVPPSAAKYRQVPPNRLVDLQGAVFLRPVGGSPCGQHAGFQR